MGAEDMTEEQRELARILRQLMVGDGHWDGSVWVIDTVESEKWHAAYDAGEPLPKHGPSWCWIQDYALDWVGLVDDHEAPEPRFTHIPLLTCGCTEGAVLEMLRDEPGCDRAYARPVRQARGAGAWVQGWVAYVAEPDGAHAPIEPRGPIYGSAVEAIGRALVHVRSVRAASKATTSTANVVAS